MTFSIPNVSVLRHVCLTFGLLRQTFNISNFFVVSERWWTIAYKLWWKSGCMFFFIDTYPVSPKNLKNMHIGGELHGESLGSALNFYEVWFLLVWKQKWYMILYIIITYIHSLDIWKHRLIIWNTHRTISICTILKYQYNALIYSKACWVSSISTLLTANTAVNVPETDKRKFISLTEDT